MLVGDDNEDEKRQRRQRDNNLGSLCAVPVGTA